jgi:hypothetical protein
VLLAFFHTQHERLTLSITHHRYYFVNSLRHSRMTSTERKSCSLTRRIENTAGNDDLLIICAFKERRLSSGSLTQWHHSFSFVTRYRNDPGNGDVSQVVFATRWCVTVLWLLTISLTCLRFALSTLIQWRAPEEYYDVSVRCHDVKHIRFACCCRTQHCPCSSCARLALESSG